MFQRTQLPELSLSFCRTHSVGRTCWNLLATYQAKGRPLQWVDMVFAFCFYSSLVACPPPLIATPVCIFIVPCLKIGILPKKHQCSMGGVSFLSLLLLPSPCPRRLHCSLLDLDRVHAVSAATLLEPCPPNHCPCRVFVKTVMEQEEEAP